MTSATWGHVKDLLHQAIALGAEERGKFLDEVCASDAALRAELDSLLSVGDHLSADFLQAPATGNFGADGAGRFAAGLAPGQIFEQRFQLTRKLGEGGMGQVWLAEQTAPVHRPVALKLIKAGMYDETVMQQFAAEQQSLAIMDHPAIAKVFDAGATPQGQPYFVMEYVPGLPITDYCDQRKLKIRERMELFIQACEGVQHAHQKAIVHRDLKPANILVIEVDGKAVPRIIDFGLAKATAVHLTDQTLYTRFGQFMGTPGYMSPEQVDPNIHDIDTRTDVYSLGVILYVLLTGLQPFETQRRQRPALDEWLRQLREEEPPRPSGKVSASGDTATASSAARSTEPKQLVSLLRGDLDWIAMKALERDRERRYGTPAELAADLRRYLHDEPVVARPASSAYQLRKFIRRHRVAAVVAGLVTVLAIAASGAGLIAVRKEREAQFQAAQALQAQSRLLIQAAAQRLKDLDVSGAQDIILEVLANPVFARVHTPGVSSVFQEIRAADLDLTLLSGHHGGVLTAAYSPDGAHIVTASHDKTARIWNARTNVQLAVLSGHDDRIWTAAFSPDGSNIVTASSDKTARIWDARTGAQIAVLSGHGGRVYSAAYSPDGTRIVTASFDRTARIWDTRSGKELARLPVADVYIRCAAYSPDGTHIVTGSGDHAARIWDARSGKQLAVLLGHSGVIISAGYSADGTRIVTAFRDNGARLWDARTGAPLSLFSGHDDVVLSASFSPDGAFITTGSADKTVRIWEARSGAQLMVLSGHRHYVYFAAYSPDGTRISTASYDHTARIWDARTGKQLAVLSPDSKSEFYSVGYSSDGKRIVTASNDRTARIWDALTGVQLAVLSGHDSSVRFAQYSPDGTRIVTASDDRTARIWDARTGAQLAVLTGHGDAVNTAAYSHDGSRIVTASDDGTARIWDASAATPLAVLTSHNGGLRTAAYSPDGMRIVTTGTDEIARIWDARVAVGLAAQILWYASAQTDALLQIDRTHLGLPADARARPWRAPGSSCDRSAGAHYDPDRVAPGVLREQINVAIASPACSGQIDTPSHGARTDYQRGRISMSKGDALNAQRQIETAVARGYRAARVDLADLRVTAGMLDPAVAASLYEQAWDDGVPIAAFKLGHLLEYGVQSVEASGAPFKTDTVKAWSWYQKGADVGEPNALGRFAERAEKNALAQSDSLRRNAQLLQAFTFYAAAAEGAHREDWPDAAWNHWRYRRASLARTLAEDGMMQQVADAYREVLDKGPLR